MPARDIEAGRDEVDHASHDLVLAFGAQAQDAAQQYAVQNQFRFQRVESVAEVEGATGVIALVALIDDLNADMFKTLYSRGRLVAPGIFCGTDANDLLARIAPRKRQKQAGAQVDRSRALLFERRPPATADPGGWTRLNADSPPARLRDALSTPHDLVALHTHSDGLDTFLARQLTLCGIHEAGLDSRSVNAPHCVVTGHCFRQDMPIEEAHAQSRLLPASALSAEILLYFVCNGFLLGSGAVDRGWGLFAALNRNPRIGTIVTSWQVSINASADFAPLVRALLDGVPIGRAIAQYNGLPPQRRNGNYLAIFGDPRAQLEVEFTPPPALRERESGQRLRRDSTGANFLRVLLTDMLLAGPDSAAPLLASAASAVTRYEVAAHVGEPREHAEGPGTALRDAVLAVMVKVPLALSNHWLGFYELRSVAPGRCPHCGTTTLARRYASRLAGLPDRILEVCACCDIITDRPVSLKAGLIQLSDTEMVLTGARTRDWRAMARWMSKDGKSDSCHAWPCDEHGLCRTFVHSPPRFPGLLRTAVVLVAGTGLAVFAGPVRTTKISRATTGAQG